MSFGFLDLLPHATPVATPVGVGKRSMGKENSMMKLWQMRV
jgi:hypothetical protein